MLRVYFIISALQFFRNQDNFFTNYTKNKICYENVSIGLIKIKLVENRWKNHAHARTTDFFSDSDFDYLNSEGRAKVEILSN